MSLLQPKVELTVSNRTIIKIISVVIGFMLVLQFLQDISNILVLIATAAFLALALNPAVGWISHRLRRRNRMLATGIAYLIVLALLSAFIALVVPPLISQVARFVGDIPDTLRELPTQQSTLGNFVRRYNLEQQINDFSSSIASQLPALRSQFFTTATKVGSALISTITVLVLTFMMLVEGPTWIKKAWALIPDSRRAHDEQIARKMYRAVTAYVNGQLIIAMIGAFFALIALLIASTIFDASVNAVALAGIVALTGLIPMFGNTLGAIIVVFACLVASLPLAVTMAIFFLVYQQIENVTIQPLIQARQNELTPLLVFVAALVGIGFGGIFGAFVAIPLASCVKILVEDYLGNHDIAR